MSNREIEGALWFTSFANTQATIGMVKVRTHEGYKYYIGNGKGIDEEQDKRSIADFGAPIHLWRIKELLDL